MRSSSTKLLVLLLVVYTFFSCTQEKDLWRFDPQNAESIYEGENALETGGFNLKEERDDDGSRCVWVERYQSLGSELYRLYSPNGNLRIIASGAQEQGGLDGYRIDYDEDGRVCNVIYLGSLEDEEYIKLDGNGSSIKTMKRWLQRSLTKEPMKQEEPFLLYDDESIFYLKDIKIPFNYKARLFIKEWGPFWLSDINGGQLGLFISVEKENTTEGSYVNYLYKNNKLIAELAYWKGVFIKARTYNNHGAMVDIYTDRNLDVVGQAYYDSWRDSKWYVDN